MTRRIPFRSLALASLILAGAACGDDDTSSSDTTPDTTVNTSEPSTPPTTSAPSTPSTEPGPDTTAPTPGTDEGDSGDATGEAAAIADLAGRLGIDESAITVKTQEEVTWRDGSAGCPQKGLVYTQALVPGRRLILTADGTDYAYHSAQGEYFYCEKPAPNGTAPD